MKQMKISCMMTFDLGEKTAKALCATIDLMEQSFSSKNPLCKCELS